MYDGGYSVGVWECSDQRHQSVGKLFLANKEPLLGELDRIINSLQQYRDAIADDDAQTLCSLLRDGRIAKELSEG